MDQTSGIKYVNVKLDAPEIPGLTDNTLNLVKDINKLCEAEQETGLNLFKAIMGGQVNLSNLRAMLWAALATAHAVTIPEAGDLIGREDWPKIIVGLSQAMGWSIADAGPVENEVPTPNPTADASLDEAPAAA